MWWDPLRRWAQKTLYDLKKKVTKKGGGEAESCCTLVKFGQNRWRIQGQ